MAPTTASDQRREALRPHRRGGHPESDRCRAQLHRALAHTAARSAERIVDGAAFGRLVARVGQDRLAPDEATASSPTAKLSSVTARQAGTATVEVELAVFRTKAGILWSVDQLWIEPFARRVAFLTHRALRAIACRLVMLHSPTKRG